MKLTTRILSRIAVLGALVVVFDYTLKFSGLKIPFPWYPRLKFDFTGIPIVLSLLLFGLKPGAFTSAVALFAILVRSGDVIGASMKALAEFSTILGMSMGLIQFRKTAKPSKPTKPISFILGCTLRVIVMAFANLPVSVVYYGFPLEAAVSLSPFIAAFNVSQSFVSMFGGYLVYEAVIRRAPSLAAT